MPRRKKRSAWASIAQVDASTYRIRYWATAPDGYRRRSKTVRGTRLDAELSRRACGWSERVGIGPCRV